MRRTSEHDDPTRRPRPASRRGAVAVEVMLAMAVLPGLLVLTAAGGLLILARLQARAAALAAAGDLDERHASGPSPEKGERRRQVRRGVTSVELAAVLPVLLLVVLGCVDLGRFAYNYIAVANSARAAAGYAMMNTYTTATKPTYLANIKQAAVDEMTGQTGFNSGNLVVPTPVLTDDLNNGDLRVQVTASYPFQTIIPWPGIPSSLTLQRTVSVRKIR